MQGDCAALPFVRHLNLKTKYITELPLEGLKVRINGLGWLSPMSAAHWSVNVVRPFATSAFLGLADGKVFGDDFPRELVGVRRSRDGPGVAHCDIAFQ